MRIHSPHNKSRLLRFLLFGSAAPKIANRIFLAYSLPLLLALLLALICAAAGRPVPVERWLAIALLPSMLLGYLATRRLEARLSGARRGALRIKRGELDARLPDDANEDEFSDLARAFNQMADALAAQESARHEQHGKLARLNHRFESVLNATNDGMAMLDASGNFVLINRRFGDLLGLTREQLSRQTLRELRSEIEERLAEPERDARSLDILTGEGEIVGVREGVLELREPERHAVQVYTAPVPGEDSHEAAGRIVALRDVTRERELDKMKTDFISVVSHELRTPLTSIKGYTDLLLGGATGELNEIQTEFLGIIQGSTTRLSDLINDILDISRIESGRITIKREPIDYRKSVADVLVLLRRVADEKRISVEAILPETLPLVRGDADKITQVLTNLMSNAIKYTPPGGWVKMRVETDGESVTTCVADSGIGISQDDQKKLFQKFFRADNSSTREAGGTGLGLVIAKTLVELLGGTIWIESETGEGSRFYFTLPLLKEGDEAELASAVPLPDRGIGLVMVVDDDSYVRGLIQHHLHRRGYGTLAAGDSVEARQKARLHKPDAITLDIMMPDMEGFALLHALKTDPATAAIPTLILSLVGDPARGALSLGAFSFLQKPLEEDRLVETVAAALVAARGDLPEASANPWARLLFVGETSNDAPLSGALSVLADRGVAVQCAATSSEALGLAVVGAPDVIVIDTEPLGESLFALIHALKAEEEAARIPIVLLTEDIPDEGIHFHLGSDDGDNAISLDYICEQLGRALAAEAVK